MLSVFYRKISIINVAYVLLKILELPVFTGINLTQNNKQP